MKIFIYNLIINILIFMFLLLVVYQIYLEVNNSYSYMNMREGMESSTLVYKDYGSNGTASDAFILSQQNAGNIAFLKEQVSKQGNDITDLNKKVDSVTNDVKTISSQLNDLAQQQAVYATELVGSTTPAKITGTN